MAYLSARYILRGNRHPVELAETSNLLISGNRVGETQLRIVSYRDFLPCCPCCNTVRKHIVEVISVYLTYQLVINQKPKLFPPSTEKRVDETHHQHRIWPLKSVGIK